MCHTPMHTNHPSTLYIHDQPDVSMQSGGVIRVHGINVWMAAAQKHRQNGPTLTRSRLHNLERLSYREFIAQWLRCGVCYTRLLGSNPI